MTHTVKSGEGLPGLWPREGCRICPAACCGEMGISVHGSEDGVWCVHRDCQEGVCLGLGQAECAQRQNRENKKVCFSHD